MRLLCDDCDACTFVCVACVCAVRVTAMLVWGPEEVCEGDGNAGVGSGGGVVAVSACMNGTCGSGVLTLLLNYSIQDHPCSTSNT